MAFALALGDIDGLEGHVRDTAREAEDLARELLRFRELPDHAARIRYAHSAGYGEPFRDEAGDVEFIKDPRPSRYEFGLVAYACENLGTGSLNTGISVYDRRGFRWAVCLEPTLEFDPGFPAPLEGAVRRVYT
jgi:hypothetical protein